MLDYIARVAPGCSWDTSACTSSLLLITAGPARGKRVTAHSSGSESALQIFTRDFRCLIHRGAGALFAEQRRVLLCELLEAEGPAPKYALDVVGEMF